MTNTTNYNLIEVEGTDLFNPLTQFNPNWTAIDTAMKANADAGITIATELKSGTVHALTRTNPDVAVMRFVATASYTLGDSFTVDGISVTALTADGQTLPTGAYVINQSVVAILVGSNLTFLLSGAQANDSAMLGGQLPSYYATDSDLTIVSGVANGASTLANNNLGKINKLSNLNDNSIVTSVTPIVPSLTNGSHGALFGGCYYYKIGNRVVVNVDVSLTSTPTSWTDIFTLPAGYRYRNTILVSAENTLLHSASFRLYNGSAVQLISLDGNEFVGKFEFDAFS